VTLTTQTPSPPSGAYTINSAAATAGTNFASFTDAANALNLNGVSGPVTFAVMGGPYTEQFLLGQINGSSATNTIVVNGGGHTIQFASANTNQRAVVQLNGTDYTTINNLVIDATGGGNTSGTYGYGVLLTNTADNDRITNNIINADITATSSNFVGIVVSGSTSSNTTSGNSASSLLVEGNTVNGGYYGISFYGNTTTLNMGNIVRNNTVRDFYFYGIYSGYQDGAQFIGNDISRPLRTNGSSFYGIYVFGASLGLAIEKNRIHDTFAGNPTSTSSVYGIYLSVGTVRNNNDIVNNVFYNLSGSGTQYLIYNLGSTLSRIYNNTITSDDQTNVSSSTAVVYGIYNSGATVDVANNVVSITRSGTGTKYGLYYTTATTTSNYNDIFVPAGNVGYYNAAFATLANWKTANGNAFDANSVSTDPVFAGASTGNLTPSNVLLNNTGTPLARVTDDITGATRGALPDMGAYEFTPVATDVTPVSLVGPAAGTACYSGAEPIIVQIRNGGTATLGFATATATVTVVATPPTGAATTFTTTVNTGTLTSGATLNVTLPGTLNMTALGTYSFAVTATVVGDQNPGNNALTPAPTRTVVAPAAGVLSPAATTICISGTAALTLTGSANGNLQYQSSPSATGTFTDIAGATSAALTTPVITTTTYYRVRTTCNATTVYSNVSAITVSNPLVATTNTPLTICAGSTATLTATTSAGSTARFYSAATGGTALTSTTVGSYTTPALTASTTYYAAAVSGGQENVGKPSTNGADGTNTTGGLYFTATGPTTIVNVTVYRTANAAAGTATVYLLPGSTTSTTAALATTTVTVPANTTAAVSPTVLTLNFAVPAAGSYTLYLGAATPSLIRDYSTLVTPATAFPYTSPNGVISITDGSLVGYYYFFYNWQIGSDCVSATRTPIVVNVTPAPTATLTAAPQPNGSVLLTATAVAVSSTEP
ncbi:MAG: right-handed parallel beta-helix repeat-containing protein, partial [Cytophagaceae bacterium]